jgi:hypothetical protein
MSRVKTNARIESDYNGSRRRQAKHIACKSKTGIRRRGNQKKK